MKLSRPSRWALLLPAVLSVACSSKKQQALSNTAVAGIITSEANVALAGASVALPGQKASVVTDGNGTYTLPVGSAKVGETLALSVTHPDYSTLNTRVTLTGRATPGNYALRAHGTVQQVTLPSGDKSTPLSVSTGDANGGGATLRIAAGDLVTPGGQVATGSATVKMAYWDPAGALDTAPAPLLGRSAGDSNLTGLLSYGMANIEISQGNDVLQVASGRSLSLNFNSPTTADANLLKDVDPTDPAAPQLWYADPNSGAWVLAGSMASGEVSLDANTGVVRSKLPHLSGWNIDGVTTTNLCLSGNVVKDCGGPQANSKLTLWIYASGQLAQYTVNTDAAGHYTANLTGSSNGGDRSKANFYTWVSGYKDPNQTACNPTGKETYSQLCTSGDATACAGADIYANGGAFARNGVNFNSGIKNCKITSLTVPMCGFVPGTQGTTSARGCVSWTGAGLSRIGKMTSGACGNAPDAIVPCNTTTDGSDPCMAANAKHEGDPCLVDVDCCPNAMLVCSDGLCVPRNDAN